MKASKRSLVKSARKVSRSGFRSVSQYSPFNSVLGELRQIAEATKRADKTAKRKA